MSVRVCAAIALLFVPPSVAWADGAADLPVEVEARVVKAAEAELGRIEKQLRANAELNSANVANITLPLQAALENDLGHGAVKLHPRAIYETCMDRLRKGDAPGAIGKTLVEMYRRGELGAASTGEKPDGAAVKPTPLVKKVASFIFDKERLRSPDPHLPDSYRVAPGEKLKGLYQICVDTTGKVTKVTTLQSISGADQYVMEQIHATWVYRPQPVPVCTTRAFVFQFN